MSRDEVVAFVGGGGKTTAMFRLAGEMVETGEHAITTTTTHIFAAQIALAPAHVAAAEATQASVSAALSAHGHVLVIGATDAGSGRAGGVAPDLFRSLRAAPCGGRGFPGWGGGKGAARSRCSGCARDSVSVDTEVRAGGGRGAGAPPAEARL